MATSLAAFSLAAVGGSAHAGATDDQPSYFVAIGGSGSVGFQPTLLRPRGLPSHMGYANDLLVAERSRWNDLRLVDLGCPGETTATMIDGGDGCHYGAGSQLATALSFLEDHPTTVLMTIDLGYNDLVPCMLHETVDEPCVSSALALVRAQLSQIVSRLQRAGGPDMRIIGVGHYDPYLGAALDGAAGRAFATESLGVISRLNDTMRSAYSAAGVPMADVAESFDMTQRAPTVLAGVGAVPRDVARTCTLTWMCVPPPLGPNRHPNNAGYRVISGAISDVLSDR